MRTTLLSILFLGIAVVCAQHSNEFYIKGAHVTIESGGLLHVQGDIHLDQGAGSEKGRFNNDGILEIRGDFYLRSNNVEQTNGVATLPGTSTGIVRFRNSGFAMETDHQDETQAIVISAGVTDAQGERAFYNVQIQNDDNSSALATDNIVYIDGGDVEVKNNITFNNDSRIRTDVAGSGSTPPSGEDYNYQLYISNSDVSSLNGTTTTAGDNKRYIEGKFARQVSGSRVYYFPVGLYPGFSGSDGMASFQLTTSAAQSQKVSTYLSKGETDLAVPQIYCDIGDYPDAASGSQPWSTCVGGPDGLYDFAHLNLEQSHEWVITNSGADFTYSLEVFPGPGLDATIPSVGSTCGSNAYHLRFLAKDGALMDAGSIGSIINAPSPFTEYSFPIGYDLCPPATKQAGNVLTGLTSFSRFRLHGANDNQTVLPVELVSLEANPIDNTYIEVFWTTATEINNDGFDLERSTNGFDFEKIAWIDGNGTTMDPQSYRFDDREVNKGITFYYRLKQIDFDGTYEYSPVVNAALDPDGNDMVMYPNPVADVNPVLEVFALQDFQAEVLIMNAIGQEVKRETLNFSAGYNEVEVPTENIAAGTYIVNVLWNNRHFSDKLVVLRNK